MPVVYVKHDGTAEPKPYWVDQRTSTFPDNQFPSPEQRMLSSLKDTKVKNKDGKFALWKPVDIIDIV